MAMVRYTGSSGSYSSYGSSRGQNTGGEVPKLRKYSMDTADIIAIGILILAIAAALVAIVVAFGFVFGKVNGADTLKLVGTCVGGSTISGIVAALVGRKSRSKRRG